MTGPIASLLRMSSLMEIPWLEYSHISICMKVTSNRRRDSDD